MKKVLLSVLLLMFTVSLSFAQQIVFIDIKTIVEKSEAGKQAQAILEKEAKEAQKFIETKAKLIKQGDMKAQQELQQLAQQKQQELVKRRQEIIQDFMGKVEEALNKFAKKNNFLLVLDKQAVLYGKPELDKTDEFLKFFNEEYKKGKKLK